MRYSLTAALCAAAFLAASPADARLSRSEQRMVQTIDAEQQRTVDMLEKWVNQNSGTLNTEGVTKASGAEIAARRVDDRPVVHEHVADPAAL